MSGEGKEGPVLTCRRGHIMIVTISREHAANSVDPETAFLLDSALNEAEEDDSVYAVILTGAGSKFFCTGQDLKCLSSGNSKGCAIPGHGWAGITERVFPKPLLAAVNGYALGGGTEIALACDMIVASENASFGLPEVKRGIFAAGGGPIRLAHAVSKAAAMELLLTGDAISAERALQLGLINYVVPARELLERTILLAEKIAANAPLSLRYTKQLYSKAQCSSPEEAFATSKLIKKIVFSSSDAKEGPRAFAEKRQPVWTGR